VEVAEGPWLARLGLLPRFDPPTEREYLSDKFLETRSTALVMGLAASLLAIGLWSWDWVHDPVHGMQALPRRILLAAILLIYPVALAAGLRRSWLPWCMAALVLATQAVFLWHLDQVETGLVYGIAGFMYWFLLPIFMGLPYRFRSNLLLNLVIAALPNLLVRLGIAPSFELDKYNVLIWPTCGIAILVNLMLDQLYRRLFRYRRDIEDLARFDPLTGLANRRYFFERAEDVLGLCCRHQHAASVLMIDIDHFKRINDTHGHPVGDRALAHVASHLRSGLRRTDLVGRYGGEEFAVVLPETAPAPALLVAEKVRRRIEEGPLQLPGHNGVPITVSIGVTGLDRLPRQVELEQLLRSADQALYRAKRAGRNQVEAVGSGDGVFDPDERLESPAGAEG
jgi:diguanylate cyclase (GGDEF)-like protein